MSHFGVIANATQSLAITNYVAVYLEHLFKVSKQLVELGTQVLIPIKPVINQKPDAFKVVFYSFLTTSKR